ncbi:selenoprotein F-like [Planococcus citri]|uniref:selenoprotein F-like n=1 Tax=Planococcus citri TaxID=170843 RepID=UPI0031F7F0DB
MVSRRFSISTLSFLLPVWFLVVECKTAQECLQVGYNSTILKCTSCSSLSKFNLEPLRESCLQCCQFTEDEPAIKKYSKARLEICTCKFGAYPQIQAFIKSKLPEQHPNLQIRYVHGRDPIIKLIDETDEVKEIIAIEKWNTETVNEYLKTHVENDDRDCLKSNLI